MSERLLKHFDLLATAPDGVAKLRELILTLAVQGKLVPQDPNDEPASVLLERIRAEKERLIAEGKIKRNKPLPPIADEETPFELPKGWEWARIPEVSYNLGQGEPKEQFSYIDVAAIDNTSGVITSNVQVIQPDDAPSRARKIVDVGTVLYSTVRPYLKNIAVVEKDYHPKPIASTAFAVMHPHTGIQSHYLLHYLRSPSFTDFVNSKAVGVTYPAINDANFFQGTIPLPPTTEQSRIVARVEELMRLCDALEAKRQLDATQHAQLLHTLLGTLTDSSTPEELTAHWQRVAAHFDLLLDRPEAVDALEQTILQLAVRGLLVPQDPTDEPASVLLQRIRAEKDRLIAEGKIKRDKPRPPITDEEKPFELPQGWEWVRLGIVAKKITDGTHHSPANFPTGDFMYLSAKNIKPWGIDLSSATFVSKAVHDEIYARCDPELGDILYIKDGATTGVLTVNTLQQPFSLLSSVGVIKPSVGLLSDYMALVMQSPFFYQTMRDGMSGVAITRVTLSKLADAKFPLPPLPEQSRIVTRVEELRQLCAELRQRLIASRTMLGHLAEVLIEDMVI